MQVGSGSCADDIAMFHAPVRQEMIGEAVNHLAGALDYDDLQAIALVKVDVSAGAYLADVFVLQVSQLVLDIGDVMVIDQGDGANYGALGVFPLSLHQVVADQIADALRAALIASRLDELVEALQ